MLAGAVHRACVLTVPARPAPAPAGATPEEAEARIVADDKLVALMGVMLVLPTLMNAARGARPEPFGGLDGGWRWLARALNALDTAQTLEQCSAIVAFLEARARYSRAPRARFSFR